MTLPSKQSPFLSLLHTPLGKRTLYDSVCFCNRCGLCAPVCPAYQEHPQESNSPRGRNQALRGILEGKIKPAHVRKELVELLASCTLCGRCQAVCPGQIPTAQHLVELRRLLRINLLPSVLFNCLRLRGTAPRLFAGLVHTGLWLRRFKFFSFFTQIPGLTFLKHADNLLPARTPKPFSAPGQPNPNLIYLPSLEAEFFLPDLARRTYQTASAKYRLVVWSNTASGLFEFVYGDLQRARHQVRRLITRHHRTGKGNLPLLTDSIDVYHFLKQAPQLFESFPTWQQKAEQFASCLRFVTDILPPKPAGLAKISTPVLWMPSALFFAQSPVQLHTAERMRTLFKKNLVECGYKQPCVAPAGYGFIKGSRTSSYHLQAVRTVAQAQAQTVLVLSGLAALELGFWLRQFYPTARACHIAELDG